MPRYHPPIHNRRAPKRRRSPVALPALVAVLIALALFTAWRAILRDVVAKRAAFASELMLAIDANGNPVVQR